MDGERSLKKQKTTSSSTKSVEYRKKLISRSTLSSKTNTVATRILLDDARNGFKNGNFVCSPFSLETVLGMLAAGAEGKTLKQLLEFLGHETIDQLLSKSPSAKLLARLSSNQGRGGKSLDISLANGIWVDKKLSTRVQSRYKEVLQSVYKTEAKFVDFKHKTNQSARNINSWVKEKTRGLIPTIVGGGDLKDSVIALVNALYFKRLWSKPFDAKKTKVKDFHLMNGKTVSVPFMTSLKKFNYGCFEGCKILQVPYESKGLRSNQFSMYIFLPDRKDGLQELLEAFHSDSALFHTRFYLQPRILEKLWIPKFKISYKFEADNVVKQMGLTLPFKRTNKEFSQIVQPTGPEDDIYVSKILQKSVIEIDETGTEAAAASFVGMRWGCPAKRPPPPPPARFVADHPFMFMIREDTSQAVFFIGVVLNPRATD